MERHATVMDVPMEAFSLGCRLRKSPRSQLDGSSCVFACGNMRLPRVRQVALAVPKLWKNIRHGGGRVSRPAEPDAHNFPEDLGPELPGSEEEYNDDADMLADFDQTMGTSTSTTQEIGCIVPFSLSKPASLIAAQFHSDSVSLAPRLCWTFAKVY